LGHRALHLVLEGLVVLFLRRRAHVSTGGEDVAVFADIFDGRRFAEAGYVAATSASGSMVPTARMSSSGTSRMGFRRRSQRVGRGQGVFHPHDAPVPPMAGSRFQKPRFRVPENE
jgi:hypothetical protein